MQHDSDEPQPASHSTESVRHSVRGGVSILAVAQIISQAASLGFLACLYRLVGPESYGLLWMVVPWLMFLKLLSTFGIHVALVQQGEISDEEVSSLFWFNVSMGIITASILACAAPFLAEINDNPQVIPLAWAMAGLLPLMTLGQQHQALLERKMRFGRLSTAKVVAQLVGGSIGVATAWYELGVWSLVILQYAEWGLLGVGLWIAEPWRPRLCFRGEKVRAMVRLGGFFTAASFLQHITIYADKIIIGVARHSEKELGLYSQAFNLMMKIVYLLTTPLAGIVVSGLSKSRHEPQAFQMAFNAFYRLLAVLLIPAAVGLAIVAPEAVDMMGARRWKEAAPLLAILAFAIPFQGFVNIAAYVHAAAGRADHLFYSTFVMTVTFVIAFIVGWLGGEKYGSVSLGIAAAYAACMTFVVGPWFMLDCIRTLGLSVRDWGGMLIRPAFASAVMGVSLVFIRGWLRANVVSSAALLLLLEIPIGLAIYGAIAWRDAAWFLQQLRKLRAGGLKSLE